MGDLRHLPDDLDLDFPDLQGFLDLDLDLDLFLGRPGFLLGPDFMGERHLLVTGDLTFPALQGFLDLDFDFDLFMGLGPRFNAERQRFVLRSLTFGDAHLLILTGDLDLIFLGIYY